MDKRFLFHLKKVGVRRKNAAFFRLVPVFPKINQMKQPTGRCSKNCLLRDLCFKFLKNTCERENFLV